MKIFTVLWQSQVDDNQHRNMSWLETRSILIATCWQHLTLPHQKWDSIHIIQFADWHILILIGACYWASKAPQSPLKWLPVCFPWWQVLPLSTPFSPCKFLPNLPKYFFHTSLFLLQFSWRLYPSLYVHFLASLATVSDMFCPHSLRFSTSSSWCSCLRGSNWIEFSMPLLTLLYNRHSVHLFQMCSFYLFCSH